MQLFSNGFCCIAHKKTYDSIVKFSRRMQWQQCWIAYAWKCCIMAPRLKAKILFLVELHFKRCKSFCKLFKALKAFFIKVLKLAGTSFVSLFQLRQAIGILKKTCLRRPIEILYFLPGRFSKCLTLLFVFSIRGHMQAEACIYKQGIFIHVFPIRIIVPWL